MSPRNIVHPNDILQEASDYLEYHSNMYVSTLLLLSKQAKLNEPKTIQTNSVLDSHMIHARVLIHFLSRPTNSTRPTDVIAVDFFHDKPNTFEPLDDEFLDEWAGNVGAWMVHITTKPMPTLKSQQGYPVPAIADKLVLALHNFVTLAPEERFKEGHHAKCMEHLARVML